MKELRTIQQIAEELPIGTDVIVTIDDVTIHGTMCAIPLKDVQIPIGREYLTNIERYYEEGELPYFAVNNLQVQTELTGGPLHDNIEATKTLILFVDEWDKFVWYPGEWAVIVDIKTINK